ncbi:TPR repeat [hydrothermal vent metagenome]|uniref:TPR repeat n=1 Tax=hydrothermal vent metagenome TaxID=652676 RepID=A0A3B0SVI3_9ZZZZ
MKIRKFARAGFVAGSAIVMAGILPHAGAASDIPVNPVQFENSCSAAVQTDFSHAVALLHSFEYPESPRIFKKIIAKDPDCAMAYWGVAMNLWHPLWAPPSKENLQKGAKLLSQTDALAKTPREAAYIDALKAFYSSTDTTTNNRRERAYEEHMRKLYENNLDDPEATLFYALSILSTADARDKSYSHQYKAAALLNWTRASHPTHPGVLHYLIHAYDFPGLAHLALGSAKTYAAAAPDSAHAQHMPSHIFTRLGLWELSLSSNHDSTKSAANYTEDARLPGYYDQGIHAMDYLMYAMLQTARDDEARALLDRSNNIEKAHHEMFAVAFTYAALPARFALERRQWDEASKLTLGHAEFPWQNFKWAPSAHFFARGLGAARSGKTDQARQEIAALKDIQASLPDTTIPYLRDQVQVQIDAIKSWILLSEGKTKKALKLARITAEREDGVDKHPVTPGEVLPARELYADMLLETGENTKALEQYRVVLKNSPNRLNALIGAAQAAAEVGDVELSQSYEQIIRTQTASGNRPTIKFGDT